MKLLRLIHILYNNVLIQYNILLTWEYFYDLEIIR